MTSSPSLKRRREVRRATNNTGGNTGVSAEPSREAAAGWGNDFPVDFEVLSKIGEGSFGTVWTAREKGKRPSERGAKERRQGGQGGGKEEEGKEEEEDGGRGEELVALKRINPTCSPSRILNEFEQMRKLGGERAETTYHEAIGYHILY